ncbi:skin secretory protein xP2-like [Choloepus didactylus]|uniref:skin secretory protein xP2-like n=1 Tax=Choloepus didactylus TaxID=27675 RepID=UPI00189D4B21|nr:skin secretory protein xP2-like [Choloepus didactylus]
MRALEGVEDAAGRPPSLLAAHLCTVEAVMGGGRLSAPGAPGVRLQREQGAVAAGSSAPRSSTKHLAGPRVGDAPAGAGGHKEAPAPDVAAGGLERTPEGASGPFPGGWQRTARAPLQSDRDAALAGRGLWNLGAVWATLGVTLPSAERGWKVARAGVGRGAAEPTGLEVGGGTGRSRRLQGAARPIAAEGPLGGQAVSGPGTPAPPPLRPLWGEVHQEAGLGRPSRGPPSLQPWWRQLSRGLVVHVRPLRRKCPAWPLRGLAGEPRASPGEGALGPRPWLAHCPVVYPLLPLKGPSTTPLGLSQEPQEEPLVSVPFLRQTPSVAAASAAPSHRGRPALP